MPAAKFWIVFLLASGFAAFALISARKNFIKSRLIEDMPTSLIRSASQGYVELVGLATLKGQGLKAPLSGRPCLWWRYKIERHQKSGKSSSWKTVEKGVSKSDFFMDDGSGICRIEPAGAEISCLHKKIWYGHSRTPPTATIKAPKPGLLNRLQPFLNSGRYRYTEFLIREGDPLYLLGHFVSDASGQRTLSIDQVAGQVIREWKKDFDNLLVRFDRDGNGRLDDKEWSLVQQAAKTQAVKKRTETAAKDMDHSVTKPADSSLPYLIGSQGQESLSRKFRWWALASAAAFMSSGALAAWLSSSRF